MATGFHFMNRLLLFPRIRCHHFTKILTVMIMLFSICMVGLIGPSSVGAFSVAQPVPQGQDIYGFLPVPAPEYSDNLSSDKPLGFGTAASGGSLFDFIVSIPSFRFPVDVYLAVTCDALAPGEIFLFTADNDLVALSTATKDIRFKKETMGNTYETILKGFPTSALTPYKWMFYLFITPADSFNSYVGWVTQLDLSQGASGGSGGTPSPGTGGGTSGTVAGALLSGLGAESSANISKAASVLVSTIQEGNLDSVVTAILTEHPEVTSMITRTGDGYKVDFGTGHTFPSGTTVAGSMTVALTQHQSTPNADNSRTVVIGSYRFGLNNLKINGSLVPDDAVVVGLHADVIGAGTLEGTLNLGGSAGSRGGVVFDTRKCPQYPLAGYMKVGNDIVNFTPGCSGTYTAGGRDVPTLDSVTPNQIAPSASWSSPSIITLHGSNLWPPYIYDHEGGIDADYIYRCHIRLAGGTRLDSYVTAWTPDSITIEFPPGSPSKGTHKIYLEDCPWATMDQYEKRDEVTLTVK